MRKTWLIYKEIQHSKWDGTTSSQPWYNLRNRLGAIDHVNHVALSMERSASYGPLGGKMMINLNQP